MEWWVWFAFGLVLVGLELATAGGFFIIFFGIAALVVGVLDLIDFSGPLWVQLLLFSTLSVASLLLFRNPLIRWMALDRSPDEVDSMVGETAIPLEDIGPGAVGRAELRGSAWTARNAGSSPVGKGQRCRVVRVDQLTLVIEAERSPS